MKQSEVTLKLNDGHGRVQEVTIRSNRFTIGRSLDNDLVINDSGLSRRHALIESFEGIVQISDCGSQNGTFVNGRPINRATVLNNGDLISIGSTYDITVHINTTGSTCKEDVYQTGDGFEFDNGFKKTTAGLTSEPRSSFQAQAHGWIPHISFSPIRIATVAIVLIPLAAWIIIAALESDDQSNGRAPTQAQAPDGENRQPRSQPPSQGPVPSPEDELKDQIKIAAKQVMRLISNDTKETIFPDEALNAIKQEVGRYRNSSALANAIRTLNQRGSEIAAESQGKGVKPGLVIYAALAETDGGRTGNLMATAQRMIEDVKWLLTLFGSDANSTLIAVAAYRVPGGTIKSMKSHPLLPKLEQEIENTFANRNIWYLHDRKVLDRHAYEFVIRFLALGVIGQNPSQYGVAAPPLKF